MNECLRTYELLNHIWSDDIRSSKTYLPIQFNNKTFLPPSLYLHTPSTSQSFPTTSVIRHQRQKLTTLYTTRYGINGWRVIRLPAHRKKPVESTFLSRLALVPATVETCRTKRRPWRRDDVTRDCRESGRRGEMSALERVRKKTASHLPACPHYKHSLH